jgi:hypothetical protein
MNGTRCAMRPETKATSRESRSSFETSTLHLALRAARRLKKPQSFIAKYEGGERRIDVLEFLTIARAVGAEPTRLLKTLIRRMT